MMNFTTFDIKKIFGIKRHRLQQWIEKAYISPSINKAKGVGSKSIFSLRNLYGIQLFIDLIEMGYPRGTAQGFSDEANFKRQYFCISQIRKERGLKAWKHQSVDKMPSNIREVEFYCLIVNLATIVREVNNKIDRVNKE